jgi:hypothetical protein
MRPAPAWRAASRRSAVKLRVCPALYSVMEPGEKIWAGVLAATDRPRRIRASQILALAVLTVMGAGAVRGVFAPQYADPALICAALSMLTLGRAWRRHLFLAVTDRQVICVAVKNDTPAQPLFAAPRDSARVSGSVAGMLGAAAITYHGRGVPARGIWLLTSGQWRLDLDEVVASLQAGGSVVQNYRRPMPQPQAVTASAFWPATSP